MAKNIKREARRVGNFKATIIDGRAALDHNPIARRSGGLTEDERPSMILRREHAAIQFAC